MRFARDRTNTDVLLGNHEAAMLWALRDSTRIGFWMSIGGQRHDLDELRSDEPLQRWLRGLPSLIRLPDRTLLQHCGNDGYLSLVSLPESDPVTAINERARPPRDGRRGPPLGRPERAQRLHHPAGTPRALGRAHPP